MNRSPPSDTEVILISFWGSVLSIFGRGETDGSSVTPEHAASPVPWQPNHHETRVRTEPRAAQKPVRRCMAQPETSLPLAAGGWPSLGSVAEWRAWVTAEFGTSRLICFDTFRLVCS